MASSQIWSGKLGQVSFEFRTYPKPCGSDIFGDADPLPFATPTINNDYMTFSEWKIALKMSMLSRDLISSLGKGYFPTMMDGTISLTGVVPKDGNPGIYIGCPLWLRLKLKKDSVELVTDLPILISSLNYNASVAGAYSFDLEANLDWSFTLGSSDPNYAGWATIAPSGKVVPRSFIDKFYPFVLLGRTAS